MKQIYTLIALLILSTTSFAQRPVNKMTDWWGNWSNPNHWSLSRIPQSGDSIVVPQYYGVVMNIPTTLNNIRLTVAGTLEIKDQLALDKTSEIKIVTGGVIRRFGSRPTVEVITINGVKKFDEKSNQIPGYAVANINTVASPFGFSSTAIVLPVKFSSFFATKNGQNVNLNWSTEIESDNSHFNVEKSVDGSNWKSIAMVMGNGNSSTTKSYSYTDKNVQPSVVYYRLSQVDVNGNATYTSVKVIRSNEESNSTTVYATSKQSIAVDFNKQISNNMVIRVFNTGGQIVAELKIQSSSYRVNVPVANAATGIYVVQVSDNNGFAESKRVML